MRPFGRYFIYLLLFFSILSLGAAPYTTTRHITKMAKQVHLRTTTSLYCQLPLDDNFRLIHHNPFWAQQAARPCRFQAIVPLEMATQHATCWRQPCVIQNKQTKGKRCCRAHDARFRAIESDLHNVAPIEPFFSTQHHRLSIGPLSSEYLWHHPQCQLKLDLKTHRFEPPDASKGVFARSYLYLHDTYQVAISPALLAQLKRWHVLHPPEPWERAWARQVEQLQGRQNLYRTSSHYG